MMMDTCWCGGGVNIRLGKVNAWIYLEDGFTEDGDGDFYSVRLASVLMVGWTGVQIRQRPVVQTPLRRKNKVNNTSKELG
jgi:hypothetical protein